MSSIARSAISVVHKHCSYQQFLQTSSLHTAVKFLNTHLLAKVYSISHEVYDRAHEQHILQAFLYLSSQNKRKRCTLWLIDICFPYWNAMSWISALCFASSIAAWQLFASKALCDRKTCSFHLDMPISSVRQFSWKWNKDWHENTKTEHVSAHRS